MGATQSHERLASTTPVGPAPVIAGEPDGRDGATIANRYLVVERIHAGSAGILYRADDLAFSRPVALRVLTPTLSRDENVLARLQARLAASAAMCRDDLGASGDIVDLLDLGHTDDGLVFVVTEFLTGESLAAVLEREGPFAWPVLRPLMVRACQILHLSHQHGLLRLDLQTRHLFPVRDKTATSTLKVLSPGIGDVFGDSLWTSLEPGAAAGHLRYAAPEQLTGATVDARTDVYALGVIMFELLSGRVPFPDTRPAYVCARHLLEAPPPFPAAVRAKLPEAVVGIVYRALAKQPEDRWQTMRALANAMAAIDFGPCDASGVLEVVDLHVPAPAASSTSMRIDPAAGHAPSPSVRPRTMPPTPDALMADSEPGLGPSVATQAVPSDSTFATPVRWFSLPDSTTASASNSANSLAWDEILAAAEEAIAAVAASASTGTAGDSDVFMPERMLHTGEAATASTIEGRLVPELAVIPTSFKPAPTTSQPTEVYVPAASFGLTAASSVTAESAADSIASLRAPIERSAGGWPPAAASPTPRRSFTWAAAAVLAFGATAGGFALLRPRFTTPVEVATPTPVLRAAPVDHGPVPARTVGDLSSRTGLDRTDTSTRAPGVTPGPLTTPTQWPSDAPDPATTGAAPQLTEADGRSKKTPGPVPSTRVGGRRAVGETPPVRSSRGKPAPGVTMPDAASPTPGTTEPAPSVPEADDDPAPQSPEADHEPAPPVLSP